MSLTDGAPDSSDREPGAPGLVMTVEELAAALRIGRRQAYELVRNGSVPGVLRLGGRSIRISRAAFKGWVGDESGQRVEEERLKGET
jgi:excisionase family DNA binding protein